MRISLPNASVTEIFVPDSAFEAEVYMIDSCADDESNPSAMEELPTAAMIPPLTTQVPPESVPASIALFPLLFASTYS
jgi:hypothetical protein